MNVILWAAIFVLLVLLVAGAVSARQRLTAARAEAATARDDANDAAAREARHRDEADRYRMALWGTGVGIMILDRDGRVIEANPAAKEFVSARHGAALAEAKIHELARRAHRDGVATEEFDTRTPAPRSLRVTALSAEGRTTAYVEDITERRQVNAARTDFVANVSHELKTPLGALSLLAETLQTTDDPAVRSRLLGRVGEQAERMNRLVDDILDLSMVEAGGVERTMVDIHKVVAGAVAAVRDRAIATGVDVIADGVATDLKVLGSERQLASALTNLVSNAVTYTAEAAPPHQVTVRADATEDHVVIEVADTGIGIPRAHLTRIFERFYRVDPARSRDTGGTGLGLAIVRHVALNHGGSVEVESESGLGSTFRMTIPLDRGV